MEIQPENLVQLFFAVIFTPIILLLLLYVATHIYKSTQRSNWNIAPGEIEESSIQHDHDCDPYLVLRYKFFIDDQPYWGDQDIHIQNRSKTDELLLKYRVGQHVKIQFDPNDPENESIVAS